MSIDDAPLDFQEAVKRLLSALESKDSETELAKEVRRLLSKLEGFGVWERRVTTGVAVWLPRLLLGIGTPVIPPLIEALKHHDHSLRWYVVEMLGDLADPQATPALLWLLSKEKSNMAEGAITNIVRALGKIADTRAIPHLNDLLSYPAKYVKIAAVGALREISVVPGLIDGLKAAHWSDRLRAARALKSHHWRPQTAEQELLCYLGRMDVDALVRIGVPAVSGLSGVLNDTNTPGYQRERAVEALARIGSPEAIPVLLEAMESNPEGDYEFNGIVAQALRRLGWRPQTIKDRIAFCSKVGDGWNEFADIGRSAVPDLLGALKAGLGSKQGSYTTIQGIIKVLGEIGDHEAVPALFQALENGYHAAEAIAALGRIGHQPQTIEEKMIYFRAAQNWNELVKIGKPSVPCLVALVDSQFHWEEAAEALGRIGDAEAVPSLIRLLKLAQARHFHFAGMEVIITALGRIGDAQAVPELLDLLQGDKEAWKVREAAIIALGIIDDERATPILTF